MLPPPVSVTDIYVAALIEEVRGLRADLARNGEVHELRTVKDGNAAPEVRKAARKGRKPPEDY